MVVVQWFWSQVLTGVNSPEDFLVDGWYSKYNFNFYDNGKYKIFIVQQAGRGNIKSSR